ncbi:glycerol-3-phosphate 1-O-acyltransferase PlsY [Fibrella sp. HMF5335]|uniref:Glycerol-3-phosphate acyltransferase n=1 Tax=Fibrella rubiginis TaxID=2817060 RepID=A0A939GF86_9BACT|nr:glycerol-3-phosphate 1-O-acyltransferase PlsY [Fibrella rubiginis]MBO0938052.1 glycerol-3-phosphate 1-O-acyltransferase PlsY [Fibrella rubiginis]
MTLLFCVALLLAYLLGSIPTAVWYGRTFFNIDIRQHGSGNAGATNTFRVLGKRAGTIVMLVDVLKGFGAASLTFLLRREGTMTETELLACALIFGFVAVLGHLYPVFANFRGGKGVATLLGMVLAIRPDVAAVCIGVWLLVVIASQYVSLGSLLAALAFPVLLLLRVFGQPENPLLIGFGFLVFLMVVITHKKNIGRLLQGNESRTVLIKMKKTK